MCEALLVRAQCPVVPVMLELMLHRVMLPASAVYPSRAVLRVRPLGPSSRQSTAQARNLHFLRTGKQQVI